MALLTAQAISPAGTTVTYSAAGASDTVAAREGLIWHVKTAGTGTTVTIVVPGTQAYSGVATTEIILAIGTTSERMFYLPPGLADPATGLITLTMTPTTAVTTAVIAL